MNGSWSICRGNHRSHVEIEGDLLPYRLAIHRGGLWGLTIGLFLNGEKSSPFHGKVISPSLSTSMALKSPSSSICFLPYRENWSLTISISDKILWSSYADLPLHNVAFKRHCTKNDTSLIEKSIDLEMTSSGYERVLILLLRKSSIPSWDRGRFASL